MGALKWGLKATLCNSYSIVYNCALCGPFGPLSNGNFRRKMAAIVGNREQLLTITLSPHLLRPHLDLPKLRWPGDSQRESERFVRIDSQKNLYIFITRASDSREVPQTCDSQFLAPRSAIRKKKGGSVREL